MRRWASGPQGAARGGLRYTQLTHTHTLFSHTPACQARATLPAAIRGQQKSRLEALTAAIVPSAAQEEEGAGASAAAGRGGGRGGKGRRASAVGSEGASSSSSSSSGAAVAMDKATAEAIKAQARELHEALGTNRQRLPALEKDAQQVIEVLEKKRGK